MSEAFFVQDAADRYLPSELTRGPWDPRAQHGGPPAALAGHVVETRAGARPDMRVTRLSVEIMRPVPIAPLTAETQVVHAGRSVEVIDVLLVPDDGRPVLRATAQRIRTDDDEGDGQRLGPALPGPAGVVSDNFPFPFDVGYHTAIESRFIAGSFNERGPATCWMRMRVPLIAGEPTTPLSRVLVAADSGNGISNILDLREHLFINPDLSVHLHRYPAGEWVCIDSRTTLGGGGIGMADTALHDEDGPIGRAAQSLFVAPRREGRR